MKTVLAAMIAIAVLVSAIPAPCSTQPVWISHGNGGKYPPLHVSVSNDGHVTANYIKSFYYLGGRTGESLWEHRTQKNLLMSVGVDAAGKRIVAIDRDSRDPEEGHIVLLDQRGRALWHLKEEADSLTIASDGKHIVTDGEDAGFTVIDCRHGQAALTVPKPKKDLWNAWFSADGSKVIACAPSMVAAYQSTGKLLWRYFCKDSLQSVGAASDGYKVYVLVGLGSQKMVVLNARGKPVNTISAPAETRSPSGWTTISCSATGDFLLLSSGVDNPRYMALTGSGQPLWRKTLRGQGPRIPAKILPNGIVVLVGNSLTFMNRRGKIVSSVPVSDHVLPWATSPNGRYVAVGLADSRVALYAVPKSLTAKR
jgi:outer membrane protein assembly factor BamB